MQTHPVLSQVRGQVSTADTLIPGRRGGTDSPAQALVRASCEPCQAHAANAPALGTRRAVLLPGGILLGSGLCCLSEPS